MKNKGYIIIGGISILAIAGSIGYVMYRKKQKSTSVKEGKETGTGGYTIIGKTVVAGKEGYVNVRTSPEVDNESVWSWDFENNLLGKVTDNPIGTILKSLKGNDGYIWYEVQLNKTIDGKSSGYVREDAVVIK
jgi:hypothetical protein